MLWVQMTYFFVKRKECTLRPVRLADGEEPLRGHSQCGVDGAVLADVSQGVEVGQHVGEQRPTVAALRELERPHFVGIET